MNVPLLLFLSAIVSLGARAFSKLSSNIVIGHSKARYALFYAINSTVACAFFIVADEFRVELNLLTFIYSLVFALLVAASLFVSLWMLKFATISGVNILSSSFSLVLSSAMGFLAFSEELTAIKLLRIALMILAAVFVFLDEGRKSKQKSAKNSGLCALLRLGLAVTVSAVISCLVTLVTKLYTNSDAVASDNSFFFWSNAILLVGSLMFIAFLLIKEKSSFIDSLSLLRPRKLVSLAGNTVCSNIGSVIALLLVAQMDLSVYTPVASAIGVIVAVIASVIFREKLGIFSYLAATVACVAVFI